MRRVLLLALLALAGCASQIMEGYVGKSLSDVVASRGPPAYSFDTGDGTRTFLWSMTSNVVLPGSSTTNANVFVSGGSAQIYGNTTYNPPVSIAQQCTYALYAKRTRADIDGPAAWTVTGFKPPRLECE